MGMREVKAKTDEGHLIIVNIWVPKCKRCAHRRRGACKPKCPVFKEHGHPIDKYGNKLKE